MSVSVPRKYSWPPLLYASIMGFALFVFHLITSGQYGFHGDELYFIVCGNRPAWGFVDHPPFVPMVARFATEAMGINLFALRFFPALALGAGCFLTGWLARRLEGGHFAEFLAALTFIGAPMLLRGGAFLNIPVFEVLFWLIVAHLLVTLCQQDEPRWWLAIGAVCGLALLNKHTTLFLGAGILTGLLLSSRRKDFLTPWPWLGAMLAFLIILPNLLWQIQHDWATLDFIRRLNAAQMQTTPRAEFILAQVILLNLFGAIVWLSGLVFFLKNDRGHPYRIIGFIYPTVLFIMLVFQAKVYYLVPAYPMLMAGGAVWLERRLTCRRGRIALSTAIIAMGLIFLPMVTPVGSLEWKDRYVSRTIGFMIQKPTDLTFDFHYQLCRPEEVLKFSKVYTSLDDQERQRCVILTDQYDSASEVNVLGPALGLPPAISGSNSYYLWGPQGASGECVIAFGYKEHLLKKWFREVRIAAYVPDRGFATPPGNRPIFLCRKPYVSLAELWPKLKIYR